MTDTSHLTNATCATETPGPITPTRSAPRPQQRCPTDPVLSLMHRHRDVCAQAVDPLQIAANLEIHGIADQALTRYRHRDIFLLAEELYARVPREPAGTTDARKSPVSRAAPRMARSQVWLHLLPGLICAAGLLAASRLLRPDPSSAAALSTAALVLTLLAARTATGHGPLHAPDARGSGWCTCWLLAFALYGSQALTALLGTGSSSGPGDPAAAQPTGTLLTCAFALLPAAWCTRRFVLRARFRLASSRSLAEFAAQVRSLFVGTLALFGLIVVTLLAAASAIATTVLAQAPDSTHPEPIADPATLANAAILGLLLFTARLLAVHGLDAAAVAGTATACGLEAAALIAAALQRLTSLRFPGLSLSGLLQCAGPESVSIAACAAAALALLAYSLPALGKAWSHFPTDR